MSGNPPQTAVKEENNLSYIIVPEFLLWMLAASAPTHTKTRTFLRLLTDDVPSVDIMITCCGEPVDVAVDTIKAACVVDYPRNKFRVIVLDDGQSEALENEIGKLRKLYLNLFYSTRRARIIEHSKAANINHGIQYLESLDGGPSAFYAVLDVDMIVMPHWLRSTIPHLLKEPNLAITSLPQYHYNIRDSDPLDQSGDAVFDVKIFMQDMLRNAPCTGSGWVARREAIQDMGGIPTKYAQEDIATSILLRARGWEIGYVWEPLQWGLAPDTLVDHVKQWKRWTSGFFAFISQVKDPRLARMSTGDRLAHTAPALALTGPVFTLTCSPLLVFAIMVSGRPFVHWNSPQQLHLVLILGTLQLLTTWITGFLMSLDLDRTTQFWPSHRHLYLAPYKFMAILRFILPDGAKFTSTGGSMDGKSEVEARLSGSRIRMLKTVIWNHGAWLHLSAILCLLWAMSTSLRTSSLAAGSNGQTLLEHMLARLAWPQVFVLWTALITQGWKPLSYAVFAAWDGYSRGKLLVQNSLGTARYPSWEAKDRRRLRPSQMFSYVVLLYALWIFWLSFRLGDPR